tara:strand:+ start:961 stop:1224 length:264 start_codon:yes stop_codon:yes gene_type:complete
MLVRKIQRGFYEVIDEHNNHYRIEDRTRTDHAEIHTLVCPVPPTKTTGRWCIFEQSEGDWVYLDGNETLKDCLGVIETWAAASQLGK